VEVGLPCLWQCGSFELGVPKGLPGTGEADLDEEDSESEEEAVGGASEGDIREVGVTGMGVDVLEALCWESIWVAAPL